MKICICSSPGSTNQLINSLDSKSYRYVVNKYTKNLLKNISKKNLISLSEAKKKGSIFFVGTGDSFSKNFIRTMKKKNKYVISIFDHWVNYDKRIYQNNLPDEAWVYDKIAKKILHKLFPKLNIKLQKNMYFINQKKKYLKLQKNKKNILYISEPLDKKRDLIALDHFLKILSKANIDYENLLIKIHPRENTNKYRKFFMKKKINVKFFKNTELTELFSKSKIVVGRNSMGLALSSYLGLKTYYCIPKDSGKFILPIKKIKKFSKMC